MVDVGRRGFFGWLAAATSRLLLGWKRKGEPPPVYKDFDPEQHVCGVITHIDQESGVITVVDEPTWHKGHGLTMKNCWMVFPDGRRARIPDFGPMLDELR